MLLIKKSQKNESQEICFVETVYTDVIKKHANIDQREMFLMKMEVLSVNTKGYTHYTIGKRKGFAVKVHMTTFCYKIESKITQLL